MGISGIKSELELCVRADFQDLLLLINKTNRTAEQIREIKYCTGLMRSWSDIQNKEFLDSIVITVTRAIHKNDEKREWELKVEDQVGRGFNIDIWQKHDVGVQWKEGHTYRLKNAYGQVWKSGKKRKLHSSRKFMVDQISEPQGFQLMVMSDTHVGRQTHPKFTHKQIDCAGKFCEAVDVAIENGTQAVIHGGDVFHDSVTKQECKVVESAFKSLESANIPFYYILGNHECKRGNKLLERWQKRGVITKLTTEIVEINNEVVLCGVDHHSADEFPMDDFVISIAALSSTSILVLHQSLFPVLSTGDVDLEQINSKTHSAFDYVVSGHHHDPTYEAKDDQEILYAGSVEDLSIKRNASAPSIWFLSVTDDGITTRRRQMT